MEIKKIKPFFEDSRGSILDILTGENIQHVGYIITSKGAIRGKHYHEKQTQYTIVLSGKIKLISKNLLEKNSQKEEIELNEMDMVCHPPFHYHEIEAVEDSKCLILTSKERSGSSYEADTFRVENIDHFSL